MAHTPTILLTGATDGIGLQTAEDLAATGAHLILHGRSQAKLDAVVAALQRIPGRGELETVVADLSDLDQVRALAAEIDRRLGERGLDVLLNNAGVYVNQRKTGAQGHELTWTVNYLAPFLLSHLLLPALRRSQDGGRIINVGSVAHSRAKLRWDDLDFSRGYGAYEAYAQSKLALTMFSTELAQRLGDAGPIVVSLHPGVVSTKLLTEGFGVEGSDSLREGAATSVYLALLPTDRLRADNGAYYVRKQVTASNPLARDSKARERLYARSCELVGISGVS
ncbi:MAG TPA: SDR family NAD(P)-dependent oxidoreductase [Enhygromyxa sp.]|nr:SDR family NAD(P)-dependent oxidoreductase [Enhygromyxa sp.]